MNAPDILCFGEPLYEFSEVPGEAGKANYLSGFGGDVSNAAIAAARQGANVGMLCHIGQDAFGDEFMALWQKEGVDTSLVQQSSRYPTGIYYIHHTDQGHEFSFSRKGSAAANIHPDDLPVAAIRDAKLLHVTAIAQAISNSSCDAVFEAIHIAKEAETLVSYDTNLRLKLWSLDRARAIILHTASLADLCFPSLDEAQLLTGLTEPEAIMDAYLKMGAKNVILKCGENGAMFGDQHRRFHIKPHKANLVDATAAGDSFAGAFCTHWVAGHSPIECLRYANATASLTIEGYGAVAPLPNIHAVESRLAE